MISIEQRLAVYELMLKQRQRANPMIGFCSQIEKIWTDTKLIRLPFSFTMIDSFPELVKYRPADMISSWGRHWIDCHDNQYRICVLEKTIADTKKIIAESIE